MGIKSWLAEKLNPAQQTISISEGDSISTNVTSVTNENAFSSIEAVSRGISLVVNGCASLDYDVKDPIGSIRIRAKAVSKLLNFTPNPYQSANDFRLNIFTDYLFQGQVFIYFDGAHMYHLPASKVEIQTDTKTFIKGYVYDSTVKFREDEIFSFKDVSATSIYRGNSRLNAAGDSIDVTSSMIAFQKGFFDNGAVFGLVLTTENALSAKAKEKTILHFLQKYNPKKGGKRPLILDNGLKPHSLAQNTFKEMDFDTSVKTHGEKILKALGVPPILLAGGNNANITPNLRLFYLETVLPIVRAYTSALERYFGYDIKPITSSVSALQPELNEIASSYTTLVNGGIITPNEARIELRYPKDPASESDELRIPANIAGSAANASEGGRPPEDKEDE